MDEIKKRAGDEALDNMTRDTYGLGPTYKIHPNDPRRKKLKRNIRLGQIMLELVNEMGWGAMLIPESILSPDR